MIGLKLKLNIRLSSQDWVKEIVSIPFIIQEVAFSYKTIHGLELQLNGFEQFQVSVHKDYHSSAD
ncbi:hypothetical protein SAMN05518670_3052 [Paenibacillus sp. OK076]|nr:hypothetical protein SAMN05518670_3052 [Paenibacillus sp. OK076]